MRQSDPNQYPPGLDAEKVREVISHYDGQSDDDAAAEDDAAFSEQDGQTMIAVPRDLVPKVLDLIEQRESDLRRAS